MKSTPIPLTLKIIENDAVFGTIMLGSALRKLKDLNGKKTSNSRVEMFTLPRAREGIRVIPARKINFNNKPRARWTPLLFFIVLAILAYVALGNASPPRSRGARPIALGNAYVGVAEDIYSLYYNPAGLGMLNQKQISVDYGRSYSINEFALSEFNFMYATPYRWKEKYMPLAFEFYGEQSAPGAHIVDMVAGTSFDAPVEDWTRGIFKLPTKMGLALTVRHQNGEDRSSRVGGSAIALGLTTGFYVPYDRKNQFGFALRNLFLGDGDPRGPSLNIGGKRILKNYLHAFYELEYARGGTWRFKPGLEWLMARGVVRPRLGWGYRDNGGVDTLATGFGFHLSPIQVDISYLLPLKTLNDNTGQFRASLNYRFGNPQFTEIYYDKALEQASQLDLTVLGLTVKEAELKESVGELEQKKRIAAEELENVKARIQKLKEQDILGDRNRTIKKLKAENKKLKSELKTKRSTLKNLRRRKASVKTHIVKPGETLQSISKKYYGDPNQWKKIYNRNSEKIERGLPAVGAKLVIP